MLNSQALFFCTMKEFGTKVYEFKIRLCSLFLNVRKKYQLIILTPLESMKTSASRKFIYH